MLVGGLLALLYLLLGTILARLFGLTGPHSQLIEPIAIPLAIVLAAIIGLVRIVCDLETGIARTLLGTPADEPTEARIRPALWHVLHIGAGGLTCAIFATIPVVAVIAILASSGVRSEQAAGLPGWVAALGSWTPAAALAVLLLVLCAASALGAVLGRLAPLLLGPSAAEQVADARHRAADLAGRNRVARELHDSVGHSLSVVTIQAAAAQRLLPADPDFADRALTTVGETARQALEDLDYVLGVLRDASDTGEPAVRGTLGNLSPLIAEMEQSGVGVNSEITGDTERLAFAVSREAYRIVQEGLTNVLWHGGTTAATLRTDAGPDWLRLEIINPLGNGKGRRTPGGGRGLAGIAERAEVLRGHMNAGPDEGSWRLRAVLPVRAPR